MRAKFVGGSEDGKIRDVAGATFCLVAHTETKILQRYKRVSVGREHEAGMAVYEFVGVEP